MHRILIGAAMVAGLVIAGAGVVMAQQRPAQPASQPGVAGTEDSTAQSPAPHGRRPSAFDHDPDLDANDQLAPSQLKQPMPDAVAMPTGGNSVGNTAGGNTGHNNGSHTRVAAPTPPAAAAGLRTEPQAATRPARAEIPEIVECSGLFAKDSSHAKLAKAFQQKNIAAGQVENAAGRKVAASFIFDKDPKRRVEVWWSNQAGRSGTHLIVIGGESDWVAPRDVRLGLTLADIERLNGKPFTLIGFDRNRLASLSDWDGGALSAIPGGCKIGISLRADPMASPAAIGALSADGVFKSDDAAMRAANPTVSEILIAY
jgi:hypothetical protein